MRREYEDDFQAVHEATQKLTSYLDEVIGFPITGRPDYDHLIPLFFERFHELAMAAMTPSEIGIHGSLGGKDVKKDFEDRRQQDVMNLLFSYTVHEDRIAVSHGYKFLGSGYDGKGDEVHVFEIEAVAPNKPRSLTAEVDQG